MSERREDAPSIKLLVAVSGGIDSVVLLHRLVRRVQISDDTYIIIVAHFDHGIRSESAADARFVEGLARLYNLTYVSEREELGSSASENTARLSRYEFLRTQARSHNAKIVTAHHFDDMIESIAINCQRGTGWRGLSPMGADDIFRPLLKINKVSIRRYALEHRLEWVEDETNSTDTYLRNRVRPGTRALPVTYMWALSRLTDRQRLLSQLIKKESQRFDTFISERYFLTMIPSDVGSELLKQFLDKRGILLTRPQLQRALLACKVALPGTRRSLDTTHDLLFGQRDIIVTNR